VFLCVSWLVVFTSLMLKVRGLERGDRLFWERRTVLVVASDILLVALAYFSAFFLRLGFQVSGDHWGAVTRPFHRVRGPKFVLLLVRASTGGVWKYTSTPDIVRIIKAVTVGSAVILMLLVFFYRFEAFPRSMFVMEYFLLILGLAGTRFAFPSLPRVWQRRALRERQARAIVGAGTRASSCSGKYAPPRGRALPWCASSMMTRARTANASGRPHHGSHGEAGGDLPALPRGRRSPRSRRSLRHQNARALRDGAVSGCRHRCAPRWRESGARERSAAPRKCIAWSGPAASDGAV